MFQNFGIPLSRSEMKNVTGGHKYQIACICSGGSHSGDATICGSDTFGGMVNCTIESGSYCSEGGGAANCDIGNYDPQV